MDIMGRSYISITSGSWKVNVKAHRSEIKGRHGDNFRDQNMLLISLGALTNLYVAILQAETGNSSHAHKEEKGKKSEDRKRVKDLITF